MSLWFLPVALSAVALGFYSVSIKHAVRGNALMPMLFYAQLTGTLFYIGIAAANGTLTAGITAAGDIWALSAIKAILISLSFVGVFYGLRELPLSIAAPIRASSPLWTFAGGIFLYHEKLSGKQMLAAIIICAGYLLFSLIGRKEGIFPRRHRGLHLLAIGTLLASACALTDKFLLGVMQIPPAVMQFCSMTETVLALGIFWGLAHWRGVRERFEWRWTVPLTGAILTLADYLYFYALSFPETPISLVSVLRRCGVVISFAFSAIFFKEQNIAIKSIALLCVLFGVIMLAR